MKTKTDKRTIKKYAFLDFKEPADFEVYLQSGKYTKALQKKDKNVSLDCIAVAGILFTMDEYDSEGKYITWGNKKYMQTLELETGNRYAKEVENSYNDAKVDMYTMYGFRNDINYIE